MRTGPLRSFFTETAVTRRQGIMRTVQQQLKALLCPKISFSRQGTSESVLTQGKFHYMEPAMLGYFHECEFQYTVVLLIVPDTHHLLGQGQFGLCFAGEYQGKSVAVKVAKTSLDVALFKRFLEEIRLMAFLGAHENIIEFIGFVLEDIAESECI